MLPKLPMRTYLPRLQPRQLLSRPFFLRLLGCHFCVYLLNFPHSQHLRLNTFPGCLLTSSVALLFKDIVILFFADISPNEEASNRFCVGRSSSAATYLPASPNQAIDRAIA